MLFLRVSSASRFAPPSGKPLCRTVKVRDHLDQLDQPEYAVPKPSPPAAAAAEVIGIFTIFQMLAWLKAVTAVNPM